MIFYEMFMNISWKSKGQFYTPAEVSRIMAKIIWVNSATSAQQTAYDMTCWSWSLLLKVASEANADITLYWQEKDISVWVLAKMNMILHWKTTAEIAIWNTLSAPAFLDEKDSSRLKTFDFCVANPPFSEKSWTTWLTPENDKYQRFIPWKLPPEKNWDYAFLSHMIKSMKQTWKGAIILPHGVLFRGNAEAELRKEFIKYIKWIIWLPANLFYWTWIPACILILDKEDAEKREWIFMIQASNWFRKEWDKNRLREQDIHKIVNVFLKQLELPKYSRFVPLEEIKKNDYNLNIPRYIDSQEEEDIQDIRAHLEWWIPNRDLDKFENYWKVLTWLKEKLFSPINWEYSKCNVEADEIQNIIENNQSFKDYKENVIKTIDERSNKERSELMSINGDTHAKAFISKISESLLQAYKPDPLIQSYDVYQHLMDYCDETMQDDIYLIIENWYKADVKRITEIDKKWIEKDKWWTCELLPKGIVIDEYFSKEKNEIEELNSKKDEIVWEKESMEEEHSWEGNAFEVDEDEKINKALATARFKDPDYSEFKEIYKEYIDLCNKESELNKEIKEKEKELDEKLLKKYLSLTEDEVKHLVVNKKWLKQIRSDVEVEQDRVSQTLYQWLKILIERYDTTLWEIESSVKEYESKVAEHLRKMWFTI